MDIGMSIADDLEQLKNNLNKFKNSKVSKKNSQFRSKISNYSIMNGVPINIIQNISMRVLKDVSEPSL